MDGATSALPSTNSKSEDESPGSNDQEDSIIDVSRKNWEISLFESSFPSNGLYIYRNTFHLIPRSVGKLGSLKTLKFFANDIEILPPEAGDLVNLERLQVKISVPGLSGLSFEKLKCLKELELCRVPPRPSALSLLWEIGNLQCLTKLSICHFSIRCSFYLLRVVNILFL